MKTLVEGISVAKRIVEGAFKFKGLRTHLQHEFPHINGKSGGFVDEFDGSHVLFELLRIFTDKPGGK